ncbi:UNVERIFIED_CONTAM: hypothetical protein PYX00_011775 [Menopon gallinae]|uniref:Myosin motor domain-containing protein n=1 Tax=Menopon gallinae TaxID=328185 RepID=A0AAW2H955_9NEOP
MNPPKFDLVEDLASLSHLNEASVLHTLKKRYDAKEIYSYSGLFLVAINPYQNLHIYGPKVIKSYTMAKKQAQKPHIYAVASEAYNNMLLNRENQSILITGESGAGKTENTKKAIGFLAFVAGQKGENSIENQIIEANTILEAFGNAMTIRNDNSSRFGKFIQIGFDSGTIVGAHIEKYLLEKSRVTAASSSGERSYHVFYALLRGAERSLREELFLEDLQNYNYLKNRVDTLPAVDDVAMFKSLNVSFDMLNISAGERRDFFKILSVILHLGNLDFREEGGQVYIRNTEVLDIICQLLEIPKSDFLKCLLHPHVRAGNELFVNARTKEQCTTIVEALSKMLYDRMFDTVVDRINRCLCRASKSSNFIGLLDIAGFEIFKENSFEQLCINYTNEKLQQFFNHYMFVLEQELYRKENIEWDFIDFGLDLQPTIDLIEKNNPIGILSFLDEQCLMPGATDQTFMQKISEIKHGKLHFNKLGKGFSIDHYAGKVEYEASGWLTRNKDPFFENLAGLLHLSSDPYISTLFSLHSDVRQRGFFRTVSQVHKSQLKSLMDRLRQTSPHFVRCIIPNSEKSHAHMDSRMILDQLRCNGVLEGIRISRLGYPSRILFKEFRKRYQILADSVPSCVIGDADALATRRILETLKVSAANYRIGKTMVFFKQEVLADIEDLRELEVGRIAREMQSFIRRILFQRTYDLKNRKVAAIRMIQQNALLSIAFQRWGWWRLYQKVKPLMRVAQMDDLIKDKDARIHMLEEQQRVSAEKSMQLRSELTRANADSESLSRMLENERNLVSEKDEYIASMLSKNSMLDSTVRQKDSELSAVREENTSLRDALAGTRADAEDKAAAIASLSEKIERMEQASKEREGVLEDMRKKDLCRERELIHLRTELETCKARSKTKMETLLQQKDREISALKFVAEEKAKLEDMLAECRCTLESKHHQMEKLCGESERLSSELYSLKKTVRSLEEECVKKDVLNESLASELAEARAVMESKLESQGQVIKKIKEENTDYRLEIERLSATIEALEKENSALERELLSRTGELSSLKAESMKSGLSMKNQRAQIAALTEEVARLRADDAERNSTTGALVCKIKTSEARLRKLEEKLKEEKSMCKQLLAERDALEKENQSLMQNKIEEMFKREEEFTCEKKVLQLRINKLETECQRLNSILSERPSNEPSEDSVSNYEKLLQLLEDERRLSFDLKRLLAVEENKNLVLRNEKESISAELEALRTSAGSGAKVDTRKLSELKSEVADVRVHINSVIKGFNQTYFAILESYRAKMEDYELVKRENDKLKAEVGAYVHEEANGAPESGHTSTGSAECSERGAEMAFLERKLDVLARRARENEELLENEIGVLKKEVGEASTRAGMLEDALREKTLNELNYDRQLKSMQRVVDGLRRDIEDKDTAIQKLSAREKELATEIHRLGTQALSDARVRQDNVLIRAAHETLKEKVDRYSCAIEELRAQNKKLSQDLIEVQRIDARCDHSLYESKISALGGQIACLKEKLQSAQGELCSMRMQHNNQSLRMAQMQRVSDENAKLVDFYKSFIVLKKR